MKLVNDFIKIKDSVYEAFSNQKPVVVFDSSIITHSIPYPFNYNIVKRIEKLCEQNDVAFAVLAFTQGYISVGITEEELKFLVKPENKKEIRKIDRKDLPAAIVKEATGSLSLSSCMLISNMIGIRFLVTDGIDGVFSKTSNNNEIFSDLKELENTNVTLICTGIKPLFNFKETLNRLKQISVPIYGYRTGYIPQFYLGDSKQMVDCYIDSLDEYVKMVNTKTKLKLKGGQLLVSSIPKGFVIDSKEIDTNSRVAKSEIIKNKISEEDMNLFFSEKLAESTEDKTLKSHCEALYYNAKIACLLSKKYLKAKNDLDEESIKEGNKQ